MSTVARTLGGCTRHQRCIAYHHMRQSSPLVCRALYANETHKPGRSSFATQGAPDRWTSTGVRTSTTEAEIVRPPTASSRPGRPAGSSGGRVPAGQVEHLEGVTELRTQELCNGECRSGAEVCLDSTDSALGDQAPVSLRHMAAVITPHLTQDPVMSVAALQVGRVSALEHGRTSTIFVFLL